jgi:hypothetical protein
VLRGLGIRAKQAFHVEETKDHHQNSLKRFTPDKRPNVVPLSLTILRRSQPDQYEDRVDEEGERPGRQQQVYHASKPANAATDQRHDRLLPRFASARPSPTRPTP